MDAILWVAQGLLGLGFVFIGFNHATRARHMAEMPRMGWIKAVPPWLMVFIGICETLGGIGVVLPPLTGIWPWLTPLAAGGLALVMLLAFVFHIIRKEYPNLFTNFILFLLAAFVGYGRGLLLPF